MKRSTLLLGVVFICALARQACGQSVTSPTIASTSSSQTVTEGQSFSFTASVNGTAPFTYQWQKAGANIPGATNGSLTLNPVRTTDAGSYTIVVSNSAGSVTSGPILLAVNAASAPSIGFQPSPITVTAGNTLSVSVSVNGTSPFTYEWKRDGVTVATTTSSTYTKPNAQTSDAGSYTVTVTNIAGATTSGAIPVTVNPPTAPVISSISNNTTATVGSSFNIGVSASGSGSLTYQWNKDGVPISGAANSSYAKSGVTLTDAGSYTVTVTNSVGSVTSGAITLTVVAGPAATAPTVSSLTSPVTTTQGDSFSLNFSSGGTSPITVQWRKDGQPIAGATSNSYSRSAVTAADVGSYSVTLTNAVGSVTSESTSVSMNLPQVPVITLTGGSRAANVGDFLSVGVNTLGVGLSYQWRKNGQPIPGANSNTYSFSMSAITAPDLYTVVVTNTRGSVISDPIAISLVPPTAPVILAGPTSWNLRQGENLSLSVDTTGTISPTFQWRKDGTAIAGATTSTYSKQNLASVDAGAYTVVVTNSAGTITSTPANVTVSPAAAPVILQHPASVNLLPGESTSSLAVGVRSSIATTYQWRKDGVPVANGTGSSLFISNAQPANAGTYTVVVTNTGGSVTSNPAVVGVDTTKPTISFTSGGMVVAVGEFSNSLQVGVSVSNATVQWRKDGTIVPNATSNNLSLGAISVSAAGSYVATVTPPGGAPVDSRPIVVELLDVGVAPRILRQPTPIVRTPNAGAAFDCTATGEAPLTYQWRKDGVAIPGATSSSYSISNGSGLVAANAGNYSVVVTNRNGSATSDAAALVVSTGTTPPIIRQHPYMSQVLYSDANFSSGGSMFVDVLSFAAVTYQWRKDGVAIPNTNSSSFSISSASSSAGRYSVVVTNASGSVTSDEAVVTVVPQSIAPRFTNNPQSQSALPGANVTFTALATASSTIAYQWRKNGVDVPGATTATLVLNNVQADAAATYSAIATTPEGVASTTGATLALQTPQTGVPVITAQPQGRIVIPGGSTSLTVGVAAVPAATFQWFRGGQLIAGATSATLTLANVQAGDAGNYTVVAANSSGTVTSAPASVSLGAAIAFGATAPRAIGAGGALTLNLAVTSAVPLTYQWKKDGVAIVGATDATLSFARTKPGDSGSYTLVVTNANGSLESAAVVVTVASSPFAGVYFGTFSSGDACAVSVGADGIGALIGFLASRNQAVLARDFVVAASGAFSANSESIAPWSGFTYAGAVGGTIAGGAVSGQLGTTGITFGGTLKPAAGFASAVAGYYPAVAVNATLAEMHVVVAADGALQLVGLDSGGARAATGDVNASRAFTASRTGQFTYTGNLAPNGASLTATYAGGAPNVSFATAPRAGGAERLANVSTRSPAGSDARTLIAGFTVSGTAPIDVLVRASGPALGIFGLTGTLPNPRLGIFKGSAPVVQNDDWANNSSSTAAQISNAAARLGAFPFTIGSGDAAILARLDPGSYTAQVSGGGTATGVSLVEVYDASTAGTGAQKLVNLSTRADVGTGGDILIVGLVVSGTAPKKLLIRGIGPALAGFGVPGSLAAPRLQLYQGSQLLRENTGWSAGADAALVSGAAQQVAAFALANGSADCAMLLYLMPGAYTAQVSGVGGTTGVALVEVYEVP